MDNNQRTIADCDDGRKTCQLSKRLRSSEWFMSKKQAGSRRHVPIQTKHPTCTPSQRSSLHPTPSHPFLSFFLSIRRFIVNLAGHGIVAVMGSRQADQLNQLRDIFARFDMDSDGSLTHLELAALLRSLGLKPTGDQVHALLANMDSNGNGSIEFDELVETIMPEMSRETVVNQEQLVEVFRSFDRDGNGFITAAELAQSMAKMGHPLTFLELTEMFREADTDGDGVISFTEFANVMAKSAADYLSLSLS
ncbi:hypothetical protein ACLOJK_001446 [Asimina triloba]